MSNCIDADIKNYLETESGTQNAILEYLDNDNDFDIIKYLDDLKAHKNGFNLKDLFHLFGSIIDNHRRTKDFLLKIEKMIVHFKDEVKKTFTNLELTEFFSESKYFLFILIKNKMLEINESNVDYFKKESFVKFFLPEILAIDANHPLEFDNIELFNKYREIGENHNFIAHLIRNDLVEDFITYVNKELIPLNSKIKRSYFETNPLLIDKELTLIEYAAFFGSIKIFNFLKMNNVELTPSLWIYAVHSNNADLIHLLEEHKVEPQGKTYDDCFVEAVKCHHNNIANNIFDTKKIKKFHLYQFLIYDNYDIIPNDQDSYAHWNFNINAFHSYILANPKFAFLLFKASYLDINLKTKGKTVLLKAFENNEIEIIKLLSPNPKIDLNIKFNINNEEKTFLLMAIESDEIEIVQALLSNQNIDPNIKFYIKGEEKTALFWAIENDKIEIVKALLSNQNIDTNIEFYIKGEKKTALSLAIENDKIEIVQALLSNQNIDPNIEFYIKGEKKTALLWAIENDKIEIVQALLSNQNIDPNIEFYIKGEKKTALLLAIESNKIEIVQALLSNQNFDSVNIVMNSLHYHRPLKIIILKL